MNPLSGLYGAGVALRNTLYDRGVLPVLALERPVVSVGNLSAGGAGKTPFVIALGELLKRRGIAFDVLSRGYGRKTKGVRVVDPEGSASEYGDEPLLIARRLGVPVVVGESRYQAGLAAERKFQTTIHLLDDGFQHRSLAREFDIVLLAAGDLDDPLLPVGRLREPFSSLRRADAIVIPDGLVLDHPSSRQKPIWRMRREIRIIPIHPTDAAPDGASFRDDTAFREGPASAVPEAPLENRGFSPSAPLPIVFCGIARPQQFFDMVRGSGIKPAAEITFRDHHAYDEENIQVLRRVRSELTASGFLTTEKDAINLGPLRAGLEPFAVAVLNVTIDRPNELVDTILARIAQQKPRS